MSYWWFRSIYRSKNIETKFWTIWPLPRRGHAEVKWGSKFQTASNDLSWKSNYLWDYKDHKKYNLLCVGSIVREILTKGYPKVKWVKFYTTSDLHEWYQIISLNCMVRFENIYFYVIWACTFEIISFVWIQTMTVVKTYSSKEWWLLIKRNR